MKPRPIRQGDSSQPADGKSRPPTQKPPLQKARAQDRKDILTAATAGMVGAILASSTLATADATSVFDGDSLPQVLAIFAAALLAAFSRIRLLPTWTGSKLLLLLCAGLLVGLCASTVMATWWANGRTAWNGFWHVTAIILFGRMAFGLCRWPSVARAMIMLLLLGSVMLSVHSVHQVFVSFPATRAQYQLDPDRVLSELQINAPPGSPMRLQYEARLNSTEPIASFALTNSLAVVLSASLVALVLLITGGRISKSMSTPVAILFGVSAALMFAVWLLTKSRTAYVAVIVVIVASTLIAWRWRRSGPSELVGPSEPGGPSELGASIGKRRSLLAGCALVGLLIFGGLVSVLSSDSLILGEATKSLGYRIEYWRATSKMISEHWLTGVGLGNFQSYYPRYKSPTASENIADPHNWMFDIAACCSLPIFFLVVVGLVWMIWLGFDRIAKLAKVSSPAIETVEEKLVAKGLVYGAGAGWVLTTGLLLLLKEAIDLDATVIGLFVGAGLAMPAYFLWKPNEATLRGAALAAAITMVVCLLASGSWQASGIALPLTAWLAIACASREKKAVVHSESPLPARLIALGLAIAFLFQTWRPVNNSWVSEQQAQAAVLMGNWNGAVDSIRQSIATDPMDPSRYRLLIQFMIERATQATGNDFESVFEQVQEATDQLFLCDDISHLNWSFSGDNMMNLAAFAQSKGKSSTGNALQLALKYYSGAVVRYPSSVQLHAQLALVHSLLENHQLAAEEARIAIALSDGTPHPDRKLATQQIWLPSELVRLPDSAVVRISPKASWIQAEPLCQFLTTP